MPNWVHNEAIIDGPPEALDAIRNALDEGQSLMEAFVPLDSRYMATRTLGNGAEIGVFADGGYEAAHELWGTKWGDCETQITDDEETRLHIAFNTAWSPMDAGLCRLSKVLGVTIACASFEEQPDLLGWFVVAQGAIVAQRWDDADAFHDALPTLKDDESNWGEWQAVRHENEILAMAQYRAEMENWLGLHAQQVS